MPVTGAHHAGKESGHTHQRKCLGLDSETREYKSDMDSRRGDPISPA